MWQRSPRPPTLPVQHVQRHLGVHGGRGGVWQLANVAATAARRKLALEWRPLRPVRAGIVTGQPPGVNSVSAVTVEG
jgi:hypothetical protein